MISIQNSTNNRKNFVYIKSNRHIENFSEKRLVFGLQFFVFEITCEVMSFARIRFYFEAVMFILNNDIGSLSYKEI